ncbi:MULTISPECIES: helix-turn-helix transcriptional regulator [Streptomyces]|uniref:Helix-turn-helix transcriptional regulator n=1 Tax=Streptomyces doudnae TaxID=3075536 RepID=A0ABD5EYJ7_9ACTN|nr:MULTISPECIES: helix-turn-helix transcriptional regulator [unclassified Streptomyces]MDT0439763.1 helix-turn-helix transcriptional regulator [Streptomyces sp. DSM 41981]MYQ68704.1 helix-turn-helix domain-containing protein [Streptomyces sp. SID4950]SCE48320.1 Helix-turn-helix domain-containing protein [Streptomyces sp. SolWspMP-5a-2]
MPQRRVITGRSQEPRHRYAEEVRLLRTERGLTLKKLSEVVGWDPSLFGKLESGATMGSPEVAQALDHYYGTPGLLLALWELAIGDPTQFKEQYRRYMILESEATCLWHFGVSILPGLLQTDAYAREVLSLGGYRGKELDQQVEARTGRKELLKGDDAPPFRALMAEAVLRTPLRDAEAWREQLTYLAEIAEKPGIVLQVLPHSSGLNGLVGTAVMFLRLTDGITVAYTENAHRGELIEEQTSVVRLHRAYDAMRDLALKPPESRSFILRLLEEVPCEPST